MNSLTFTEISDHLINSVEGLRHVDLEKGQLEELLKGENSQQAIPFPAVFFDVEVARWDSIGQGVQRGLARFQFLVAQEVYSDTHAGASDRDASVLKLQFVDKVHKALQHRQGTWFEKLVRGESRKEGKYAPLLLYSLTYSSIVTDAVYDERPTGSVTDPDLLLVKKVGFE